MPRRQLLPLSASGCTLRTRCRGPAPERPSGHGAPARLPCTGTGRRRCSNASPPPAPSEISSVRRQGSAPALARLGERRAVFSPLGVPAALVTSGGRGQVEAREQSGVHAASAGLPCTRTGASLALLVLSAARAFSLARHRAVQVRAAAASKVAVAGNQRGAQASLATKAVPLVKRRFALSLLRRLLPLSAAGCESERAVAAKCERPGGHSLSAKLPRAYNAVFAPLLVLFAPSFRTACGARRPTSTMPSVSDDRLVRELLELVLRSKLRHHLHHEHADHLLFGIDPECSTRRAAPVIFAW